MKKKYQTTLRRAWYVILSCMAAVSSMAQEQDSVYREAVKELIVSNWKHGSKDIAALVGFKIWDTEVDVSQYYGDDSLKMMHLRSYYEKQYIEDQTDIFVRYCQRKFNLTDVKRMTADMPIIHKILLLTQNPKVLQLFQRAACDHFEGKSKDFKQPDVSNSYQALSERLFGLTNMQTHFDQYLLKHPLYGVSSKNRETFCKRFARVFFLNVCQKNASETELEACVDMLSMKPYLYGQLNDLSTEHAVEINAMAYGKFYRWKELELSKHFSKKIKENLLRTWKFTDNVKEKMGNTELDVRWESAFYYKNDNTMDYDINLYVSTYIEKLKKTCQFHYEKGGSNAIWKIKNDKEIIQELKEPGRFRLLGILGISEDSTVLSSSARIPKDFHEGFDKKVQDMGKNLLQDFCRGAIQKRTVDEMEVAFGEKKYTLTLWEQIASFPGGEKAMINFMKDQITYPIEAKEQGIEGIVIVEFTIMEDGSIIDIQSSNGESGKFPLFPLLEAEVVRAARLMPAWYPSMYEGKWRQTNYSLPVIFKLRTGYDNIDFPFSNASHAIVIMPEE